MSKRSWTGRFYHGEDGKILASACKNGEAYSVYFTHCIEDAPSGAWATEDFAKAAAEKFFEEVEAGLEARTANPPADPSLADRVAEANRTIAESRSKLAHLLIEEALKGAKIRLVMDDLLAACKKALEEARDGDPNSWAIEGLRNAVAEAGKQAKVAAQDKEQEIKR